MTRLFCKIYHKATLLSLSFILLTTSFTAQSQVIWSSASGTAWLTGSNWTGATVPSSTQVAQFNANPTSTTVGVGIHMDTAAGAVSVGAIYVSPSRGGNLIIGNSSPATPGILTLTGATINSTPNVILADLGSSFARLQIQNKQGSGGSTMSINIGSGSKNIIAGAGTTVSAGNTISIISAIIGSATLNFLGGGTRDAAADTGVNGGILRLGNANTFTGGINVGKSDGSLSGILALDSTDAVANVAGNDITIYNNSQLYLTEATGSTYNINNVLLHLNGNGNNYSSTGKGALVNQSGNSFTWSGNIDLASDAGINVGAAPTASLTVIGNISGTGQLIKSGLGNLVLNGAANTWAGGTQINSGKITVNAASSLPGGALLMAQVVSNPSIVFNNAAQTITALSSSFTTFSNSNTITLNGTRLTIDQNTNTVYGGSTSTLTSTITGTGSVVKTGTGRLTLTSANNNFSGGLKIVSGEIRYNPMSANAVTNTSPDTLDGGTLSTNGIMRPFTFTFGTAALTNNSVIDLGIDTLHSIKFANSSTIAWTTGKVLTITNWKGGWNSTTGTKGRIYFGNNATGLTAAQRAQIVFIDGSGNSFSATQLNTGEVVPLAPTITTTPATYGGFCNTINNFISVAFSYTGPISAPFYVQLSNASGVFANDFVTNIIGTGSTSPITATIPMGTTPGTSYRVRVINNSIISVFGTNNGSNISVTGIPVVPAISGSPIVPLGSNVTWTNSLSGGIWSSDAPTIATVNSSGVITGLTVGTTYISYTVTNFCGLSGYAFDTITVVPIPVITSITPDHGNSGTTVTITGNNFSPILANNVVFFGAVKAIISAGSTTTLNVTAPVSAMRDRVTVTNLTTGLMAYSASTFNPTYDNTGLMPDSVNFKPKVNFTAGATPVGVTMGDLDGDGKPDMIVINSGPSNIYVYRNISINGTINSSSFATPNIYTVGNGPHYAKIADVDGDGLPEIIVANLGFNSITIYKNISIPGVLSFALPVSISVPGGPIDLSVADFDGDGKTDIAVVCQNAGKLSILRNVATQGTITSTSFTNYQLSSTIYPFPYRIFTADLDNDGKTDIALTDYSNNKVYVLHNNIPAGTSINVSSFPTAITLTTQTSPAGINGGDIDGDGKPELIVANSGSNTISVFNNTNVASGTLSFAAATNYTSETAPEDLAIADVDGDNKIDIAVANYSANNVSIFRNTSTTGTIDANSLATRKSFNTGVDVGGVAFADMDSDGKPDLAVVSTSTSSVAILKNYPLPPVGTITGADTICKGTSTTLSNTQSGGNWQSMSPAIATINTTGKVTGLANGMATIAYYTVAQGDTNTTYFNIYVRNSDTVRAITAASTSVCAGALIQLYEVATTGSWSSNAPGVATVDNNGFVTGVSTGTAMISYIVNTGCFSSFDTINVIVGAGTGYTIGAISGPSALCAGSTITITDTSAGGTWSSSNTTVADVNSNGLLQAISNGTATITYAISNACGIYQSTLPVTVDTTLNASVILGPGAVCIGASISLTNIAGAGGNWSASNASATINSSGILTGMNIGIDTITYSITNSCGTATGTRTINVALSPAAGAIIGPSSVCQLDTITVSSTVTGGSWLLSNNKAQIFANGDIRGITAGTDTVYYLATTGCGTDTAKSVITISPLPVAGTITGATTLCVGASTTLNASIAGGVWSSLIGFATTTDSVITGVSAGIDTIRYTVSNSCGSAIAIKRIIVNAITAVDTISGPSSVCTGASITLTNATTGGTWSKTNAKANVSATGVVTGVTAGIDTIKYTPAGTCPMVATKEITVNQTPSAGTISGPTTLCVGAAATLHSSVPNGVWSVVGTHTSLADSVITGISAGSDTVRYTITTVCGYTSVIKKITVSPLPYVAPITGDSVLYVGEQTTLKDSTTGGIWSVKGTHAIISSTGKLGALIAGQDTVKYTVTNGCGSSYARLPITILEPTDGGDITDIKLYPNPNNGKFTILLSSSLNEELSVVVANSAFQIINVTSVHTNTATDLLADNLADGVYMLSVVSKKGWHTVKFVIAK